jgi:hypothetical protein
MRKYYFFTVIATACCVLSTKESLAQDSTKVKSLLNTVGYDVPSSPAFELLPNKPSEVTHLSTGKDIVTSASNFIDNGKLKAGAAFDIRPGAYFAGNLHAYQTNFVNRLLFSSVFSMGTASESSKNSDVYIGAGLRIPLIDNGDPRCSREFIAAVDTAFIRAERRHHPMHNPETDNERQLRQAQIDREANLDSIYKRFTADHWNSLRWEIGLGYSDRAASGYFRTDSLFKDRAGIWTAVGLPINIKGQPIGQLTISGNTAWASPQQDTSENNRSLIGARAKFFIANGLALSGEYARIWSRHADHSYDEQWGHLAVVAEISVPKIGGYFSLGYGGDSAHRTDSSNKFSFSYAFYTDRMIKK